MHVTYVQYFTPEEPIRIITQELIEEWNTNFKELSKRKGKAFLDVLWNYMESKRYENYQYTLNWTYI